MRSDKKILAAFLLNLLFSVFEFIGGIFTGSVAIASDALHDLGDAIGIGAAWFLERKSKQKPDGCYTYGYGRYSVLGGLLTNLILLTGSVAVIWGAVDRLIHPSPIHSDGMIVFAVIGAVVNLAAAWFTREGDSLNQKAVNLHMLEDVLGWLVVLVGAVVIRFTGFVIIDPILSIAVAVFIFVNALGGCRQILSLLLEKTPDGICLEELTHHLLHIDGVEEVHHIHLWSMDGHNHFATLHAVTAGDGHRVKDAIREELREHGITHATIELEMPGEHCHEKVCCPGEQPSGHHHHHHHHHHH